MKLYLKGALIHPAPRVTDVERAFEAMLAQPLARLELKRDAASSITATYEPAIGFFIDVKSPEALFGWLVAAENQGEALVSLLDFLRGAKIRPAGLAPAAQAGLEHVTLGADYEPDCPLCAAMGPR